MCVTESAKLETPTKVDVLNDGGHPKATVAEKNHSNTFGEKPQS